MKTMTIWPVLLCALALAQEEKKPEGPAEKKPEEKTLALVGADVHTVSHGVLRNATILVRRGKIEKVGVGLEVPKDAEVVDCQGKVITPGFVAADSSGVAVAGGGGGGRGGVGGGGGGAGGAGGKVADILDPYAFSVKLGLACGLTTVQVPAPGGAGGGGGGGRGGRGGRGGGSGPLVGNPGAAVKLAYGELKAMLLKEPATLPLNLAGAAPSDLFELRERLKKAKEAAKKGTAPAERPEPQAPATGEGPGGRRGGRIPPNMREMMEQMRSRVGAGDTDRLIPAVKGEIAVVAEVDLVQDLRTALELAREFGLKLVLKGAVEGWSMVSEIARQGARVIVTPRARRRPDETLLREGGSIVRFGSSIENAALLHQGGVTVAILPGSTALSTGGIAGRDLMTLPLEAAFGVRGGLDEATALRAITLTPAELLGVADRIGSIDEGKDADLLVLDGDPLDYRTYVEKAYVNGKLLYDKDQETLFSHIKGHR